MAEQAAVCLLPAARAGGKEQEEKAAEKTEWGKRMGRDGVRVRERKKAGESARVWTIAGQGRLLIILAAQSDFLMQAAIELACHIIAAFSQVMT